MANPEHVAILKQGVEVWNKWRLESPLSVPDLREADLREADLREADLGQTHLEGADLKGANFEGANLRVADLEKADLEKASLRKAHLEGTYFWGSHLKGANFEGAIIGWALFGDLDLSVVKGLETTKHRGPSTIGIDTIYRSGGNIPEAFLRGAGVPETFITYARSLVNNPIEYYTCFISYSSKDQAFAERLYADLQSRNVRCWYAPEDLKIGDKFRMRIDESIRLYDKLLLVLSKSSLASNWVAYEVEKALNKEPEGTFNVLFPIRLDKTILTCETDWAEDIRKSRHIGDFEHWKDHDAYQQAFQRLLRDLKAQA